MQKESTEHNKSVFAVLAHEIREEIVRMLAEKPYSFTELSRSLNISTSKLNFHLKKMEAFISKKSERYQLSETGKIAYTLLQDFESSSRPEHQIGIASIGLLLDSTDISLNIQNALRSIDFVSSQRINLACLPFINIAKPSPIETVIAPFIEKTKKLQIYTTFGLFERMNEKKYHSTILIEPNGDFNVYRSIHQNMFTTFRTDEGNNLTVVDTKIGGIGLASSDEYMYPELFRILKLKGADYVVCPASGIQERFQRILQSILMTRALENQLVVAFSSSSFFRKETFATVCSPNQENLFPSDLDSISIGKVDVEDIKRNREIFRQAFPRRADLYGELVKKEPAPPNAARQFPATVMIFPIKVIKKRYEIHDQDLLQYEELTVFEKPLSLNIPMTGYLRGYVPLKEAKEIKWFDSFGTLEGVIIETKPMIEFLTQDRFPLASTKSYSMGFRCKTPDPIEVKKTDIFLKLSFEDYNKIATDRGYTTEEFIVEVLADAKFDFISSKPGHTSMSISDKTKTLVWKWIKPKAIPQIKIKLRKANTEVSTRVSLK